jgi:hypothetical protein
MSNIACLCHVGCCYIAATNDCFKAVYTNFYTFAPRFQMWAHLAMLWEILVDNKHITV